MEKMPAHEGDPARVDAAREAAGERNSAGDRVRLRRRCEGDMHLRPVSVRKPQFTEKAYLNLAAGSTSEA